MCVYIYVGVYMHACIQAYMYVGKHVCNMCMHVYVCAHMYIYIHACMCVCVHVHIHVFMCACVYSGAYACMYEYTKLSIEDDNTSYH